MDGPWTTVTTITRYQQYWAGNVGEVNLTACSQLPANLPVGSLDRFIDPAQTHPSLTLGIPYPNVSYCHLVSRVRGVAGLDVSKVHQENGSQLECLELLNHGSSRTIDNTRVTVYILCYGVIAANSLITLVNEGEYILLQLRTKGKTPFRSDFVIETSVPTIHIPTALSDQRQPNRPKTVR